MIDDVLIDPQKWRDCWLWYRNSPHQEDAIIQLYRHIKQVDPCLLSTSAQWFQDYQNRPKLVKSFMNCEGE